MKTNKQLFSPSAHWIWDRSDRVGYHYYLRAQKTFQARPSEAATLKITADANYQTWLNGQVIGHGPAKSAEGRLSVDSYDLAPFLVDGENRLEVLVLCIGVGTMTYCPSEAGLIFEVELPGRSEVSDAATLVQRDPCRQRTTVRRWALPCIEDVDAGAPAGRWQRATVLEKAVALYSDKLPHLHMHLVPKYADGPAWGTTFTMMPEPKQLLSDAENTALIAKIRQALG